MTDHRSRVNTREKRQVVIGKGPMTDRVQGGPSRRGVGQGPPVFTTKERTKQRCAGVLWVAVHLRHTVGPTSIAAPECPRSDTASICAARPRPAAALARSLDRARRRHARARRLDDAKSRVIARIIARACVARVRHSSARHPEPPLPSRRPPRDPPRARAAAAAAAAAHARVSPR